MKSLKKFGVAISLMILISVLSIGLVVADTTTSLKPDYAYCNMDGMDSSGVCTSQVRDDDSSYKIFDDDETVDLKWGSSTVNLSSETITNVKVYIYARRKDNNIAKAKIEKWDGTDLTDYQEWTGSDWQLKTFSSTDLTNYVTSLIGLDQKLSVRISDSSFDTKNLEIDYIWLEIEYSCPKPQCEVSIIEPQEGHWYDPINIEWEYAGECSIWDQKLRYFEGSCDGNNHLIVDLDNYQREYSWDVSALKDGDYCVCVYAERRNGYNEVEGCSGVFHLDTIAPETTISIGQPQVAIEGQGIFITNKTPITLTCTDSGSGPKTIHWRYRVDGGGWNPWNDNNVEQTGYTTFTLPGQSKHDIEYYCKDKVGKKEESKFKTVRVDLTPPIITKTVGEPKVECKEQGYDSCYYVTDDTEITFSCYDQQPHPVNNVIIYVEAYWSQNGDNWQLIHSWSANSNEFTIKNHEDSYHKLVYWCKDALGNKGGPYTELDLVDLTPPETTKTYLGPQYPLEGYPKWIDTASTIKLTTIDFQPHPVNGVTTYYKYELADDKYCWTTCRTWIPNDYEDEGWIEYKEPFGIDKESCHIIEYYSEDALGNKEEVRWQCVFVDKTAPILHKEVGKPSHKCTTLDKLLGICEEDWDWKITMDTPITLSCVDEGVHPSGIKEICYKIYLDGELKEEQCVHSDKVIISGFPEESEHRVEFYCVDNVNKISETDSELFKVEGEAFDIELEKKWNLISVPFVLISENIDEVFDNVKCDNNGEIESVWMYDGTAWHVYTPETPSDLTEMQPGWGYWVKTTEKCTLTIGGSLLSPAPGVPPSRPLQPGWNLIGHYGTIGKSVYCSLFSLIDTTIGYPRWSALYGYDAKDGKFEALDFYDNTYPGQGYWIEMDIKDIYTPATTCWGFPGP